MSEHLDRALAEEFADQADAIHRLKASDPDFKALMVRNHAIWLQIQSIQNGLTPADDTLLNFLEKERLIILDKIATRLRKAAATA